MASTLEKYGLTKEDIGGKPDTTAPTLSKYGLSPEDLPAQVKTERPDSILPEGMQNFGAGVYSGMAKAVAGPVQFTLDAIAPEAGQKFTEFVNEKLKPTEKIYGDHTSYKVGQIAGEIAPTLTIPGVGPATSVLGRILSAGGLGFVLGSTGYHKSEDSSDRETSRLLGGGLGAGIGATVQGVTELVSQGLNKVANSKEIRKGFQKLQNDVGPFDPQDTRLGQVVEKQIDRVNRRYQGLLEQEVGYAGKLNKDIPGSTIAAKVQELQNKLQPSIDPDAKVRTVLKNIWERVKPEEPEVPADIERLGPNAKSQALKILGLSTKETRVSYGDLRQWSDELGDVLAAKGQQGMTDTQVGFLREVKSLVDSAIKGLQKGTPELATMARKTLRYKEQTVDLYRNPEFKQLFEGTAAERLQGAVKIANSGDPELTAQMGRLLNKETRQQVQSGLIKDALEKSVQKNGVPDPAKFVRYFKNDSIDPLLDESTRTAIKGMGNLMTQSALEGDKVGKLGRAVSRTARLTEHGLTIGGIWHLMRTGDVPGALAIFSGNFIAHQIHQGFDTMLQSPQGRAFLIAAGNARPGSPAMARIAEAAARKFPTAGMAAQAANAELNE